jgi:hypothetical protein
VHKGVSWTLVWLCTAGLLQQTDLFFLFGLMLQHNILIWSYKGIRNCVQTRGMYSIFVLHFLAVGITLSFEARWRNSNSKRKYIRTLFSKQRTLRDTCPLLGFRSSGTYRCVDLLICLSEMSVIFHLCIKNMKQLTWNWWQDVCKLHGDTYQETKLIVHQHINLDSHTVAAYTEHWCVTWLLTNWSL